jgi:DNA-binding phage protein
METVVNVNMLKGKIIQSGRNITMLANEIGIDRATLYRRLQNGGKTMLVKDAKNIASALGLTAEEVNSIFFNNIVA